MNEHELSLLIAAAGTHRQSKPSQRPSRQHSSNDMSISTKSTRSTPLSPRALFQSRVRTLSDDGKPPHDLHPSNPSSHPPAELQHLSSLRVHVTSPRTSTSPTARQTQDGRFGYTPQEPDFITEERTAWTGYTSSLTSPPLKSSTGIRAEDDFILIPTANEPPISPSHGKPLKAFGPQGHNDTTPERPKTSRGRTIPGAFPETVLNESSPRMEARKSRFVEGSMNDRSTGVSSIWSSSQENIHNQSYSEDEDSGATPKASRRSTDSLSSSDLNDFRPSPATPATLKQRLAKFAHGLRPNEPSSTEQNHETKTPKRKGLRKSISTWSFHFGDRVKFFGSQTNDSTNIHANEQLSTLNDRKRKAEEAYAEQFGTKKQKANDGFQVENKNATIRAAPRTLKKRSVSAGRTSTTHRRRDVSTSTVVPPMDPADLSDSGIDHYKRQSRRELEKEVHQLRALLRESEAQHRAAQKVSASKSTVHLPIAEDVQDDAAHGYYTRRSRSQTPRAGIPPVPPLPPRTALANMQNGKAATKRPTNKELPKPPIHKAPASKSNWQDTGTAKRMTRSTVASPSRKENVRPDRSAQQQWDWPEDVF
jgi:hypothetical protein